METFLNLRMTPQRSIFYVPWADFSEWNTVKEQMFSPDLNDTIKAYQTILMWKLKYHSIPAYVECTYSLLQVMVKEYEMNKSDTSVLFNENELQLSYSMALIRFVNHVLSINSYKGASLYLAAKTQNIPDWIINMRHDVSHGQDLPTLDALHQAAELSLQWLLDYYWSNVENSEEKSLDLSQFDADGGNFDAVDVDIQKFFKKVFDLWELCESESYKKIQFVSEVDREFMLQLEDVFASYENYFTPSENEAYTIMKNIIKTYNHSEKGKEKPAGNCKLKQFRIVLLKFLKGIIKVHPQLKHLLVLALLGTTILSEKAFDPAKWEKVLHLIQQINSFQFLLENLFELSGKGHKGALKWLTILAPGIKNLKKQWGMFKVLYKEKKTTDTKVLKAKVRKNLKPERQLLVNLDIAKPPILTLETLKTALLNIENLSLDTITEYLNLVKPPLMKGTLDLILEAVELQRGGERGGEETDDRIYTVDDLREVLIPESSVLEESRTSNGWVKTSIDVDVWNKCPLGLLPFQSRIDCNLPGGLKWKRDRVSEKSVPVPLVRHGIAMKRILQC